MSSKLAILIVLVFVSFSQIKGNDILQSACELAADRQSCYHSLLENPRSSKAGFKDVTKISVEMSLAQMQKNYDLIPPTGWVSRAFHPNWSRAIEKCLTFHVQALSHLKKAVLKLSQSGATETLQINPALHIQTLLSAALTNQRTCLHGLQQANVNISQFTFATALQNASRSLRNSLAVVNKLWIAGNNSVHLNRRLLSDGDDFHFVENGYPSWRTRADKRRLIRSSGIRADVTVAQDGSGNYMKISAAINAAPQNSNRRYVIYVKRGTYRENIIVPASKTNITLVGDGKNATVLTGCRSVKDGYAMGDTATLAVNANGFYARGMRIENTAGPENQQAVAVMLASDTAVLYRCKIIGFQDTLVAQSGRQFYRQCDIYGTIDFICGNAAAVFQKCNIVVRKPLNGQENVITANDRKLSSDTSAIVIQNCNVIASPELVSVSGSVMTYLGRPWGAHSRTVIMQSYLGNFIHPQGWLSWPGHGTPSSVYYGEYQNKGPGARTSNRVKWSGVHVLDYSEAQQFTASALLNANQWLPSTGVPFQPTLG